LTFNTLNGVDNSSGSIVELNISIQPTFHDLFKKIHNILILVFFVASSESDDSQLSPATMNNSNLSMTLRFPSRTTYPDPYNYMSYPHDTYMMAAKSRPSPYPRNMDYTSYHHARMSMKEIYQGTPGSCGYNYWYCFVIHDVMSL
jgi:hypothetical protein